MGGTEGVEGAAVFVTRRRDKRKSMRFRASARRISQGSQQVACGDAGIQIVHQVSLLQSQAFGLSAYFHSAIFQPFDSSEDVETHPHGLVPVSSPIFNKRRVFDTANPRTSSQLTAFD